MRKIISNLKKCIIFFENTKKELIFIMIFSILSTIFSIIIPSLNGNIINRILDKQYKEVIIFAIIAGLIQIISTIFNLIISKKYLLFRKKMILNIRKKVCYSIINFNIETYQVKGQGTIINKLRDDSKNIVTFLNNIKDSLLLAISNIGVIFYVFYLNQVIGFYYLIATFIIILVYYLGIKKSIYYIAKSYELSDYNTSLLGEIVKGSKDIKTLNLKENFINKTNSSFEQISELEYKSSYYIEYTNRIVKLLESFFSGFMILLAILLISNNLLLVSDFIIIFMYKASIFTFSNKMSIVISSFSNFNLSMDRVFSILDYKKDEFGNKSIEKCKGKVTFENVDFSYKQKKVLKQFSLSIDANSLVVVVGKNGAGKSTLLSLLTKMFNPQKGDIYLDDVKLSELTEDSIRNNISLVTQQPYLFNFSIKDNLSMIDDNIDNIKEVCKVVGIDEKIESLENGYDTKLNEDGSNLSGGEKQKLAIARALLSKTQILLFDEITNNLDNKTIDSIKLLLKRLKGKYTIIMVTHNLDIVNIADRVIMLDNGKVIGDGSHKELLRDNKSYQELCRGSK